MLFPPATLGFVREAAVGRLEDQTALARIAMADPGGSLGKVAQSRISELTRAAIDSSQDEAALRRIAEGDPDNEARWRARQRLEKLQVEAVEKLTDTEAIRRAALEHFDDAARRAAVVKLTDQRTLVEVARSDANAWVRAAAAARLTEADALASILASDVDDDVRAAAISNPNSLLDQARLRELATTGKPSCIRQAAAARLLVVNADDTVFDQRTGLMWAARDNGCDVNWHDAKDYCARFSAGSHQDWRFPTLDELRSLRDLGDELTSFIKVTSQYLWSSDVFADKIARPLDLRVGTKLDISPTHWQNLRVLPVRRHK